MARYGWSWRTLPFQFPDSALPQVLNEMWLKGDEAGTIRPTRRKVNNPIARGLFAEVTGERLARRIGNRGIFIETWLICSINVAEIVEWSEKIGNEFGIVGDILVASDGFKFTGEVI